MPNSYPAILDNLFRTEYDGNNIYGAVGNRRIGNARLVLKLSHALSTANEVRVNNFNLKIYIKL